MRKVFAVLCVFAAVLVLFGFIFLQWFGAFLPATPFAEKLSLTRSYERVASLAVQSSAVESTQGKELINMPLTGSEHGIVGTLALSPTQACLVDLHSMRISASFHQPVAGSGANPTEVQAPEDIFGCDAFLRFSPENRETFLAQVPQTLPARRHICQPSFTKTGFPRDIGDAPEFFLSLATLNDKLVVPEKLTKITIAKYQFLRIADGVKSQDILDNLKFETLDALQCDGFRVLQIKASAIEWPYPSLQ